MSVPNYTDRTYARLLAMPMGGSIIFDREKAYNVLKKLPQGDRISFDPATATSEDWDKLIQTEWDRFIEAVKRFIDDDYGMYQQVKFKIEIASDYKSVWKKKHEPGVRIDFNYEREKKTC